MFESGVLEQILPFHPGFWAKELGLLVRILKESNILRTWELVHPSHGFTNLSGIYKNPPEGASWDPWALPFLPLTQNLRFQTWNLSVFLRGLESAFLTSSKPCWCCWSVDHTWNRKTPFNSIIPWKWSGSAGQFCATWKVVVVVTHIVVVVSWATALPWWRWGHVTQWS